MNPENEYAGWGTRTACRILKWLPERQVHFRTEGRVRFFRISTRAQLFAISTALVTGGWLGFTSHSYIQHDTVVAAKNGQIANARFAYRSLLGEVAEYQKKFNNITQDLENNHGLMLGLVEKNTSLQQNLKSVARQLVETEGERERIRSVRASLRGKLSNLEDSMRDVTSRNFELQDNLSSVETDLQVALSERNQALFDGSHMRRQIKHLGTRLTDLQDNNETAVERLTNQTLAYIGNIERVVEITGIKPDQLVKLEDRRPEGQGGPFIPADSTDDKLPGGVLKSKLVSLDAHLSRWETLQSVMKRLPLSAPLDTYRITSSFGKRRDPMNKRWSAHYGTDFGAPLKSPVYATAPGTVTHAGWKGKYGKFIEINHGAGVITRYGHLNKILVKRGQKVGFRDKIGLLGSTGRSTGAHLHYETAFNKKLLNPLRFIKAGRNVFQE